jgi:hypothetical protein
MKKENPIILSEIMLEYGSKLNETLIKVEPNCTKEEFEVYKKVTAKLMGHMLIEVMNPIYEKFPDLKPDQLK